MIFEGFKLMALGMGFVVFFLVLLMFCMILMGAWFKNNAEVAPMLGVVGAGNQVSDDELVAVISAAIKVHRQKED